MPPDVVAAPAAWPAWTAALLAGFAMFAALAVDLAWPRGDAPAIAFYAPAARDLPGAAALADAIGGRIARTGAVPGLWVVAGTGPDATRRLYRAGAWLVMDPRVVEFCLTPSRGRQLERR